MRQLQLILNEQGKGVVLAVAREYGIPGYGNIAKASGVNVSSIKSNFCGLRSMNPDTAEALYQALNQDPRVEFLHEYAESRKKEEGYQEYFKVRDIDHLSKIVASLEEKIDALSRKKD